LIISGISNSDGQKIKKLPLIWDVLELIAEEKKKLSYTRKEK
jgi:hypothetical protein